MWDLCAALMAHVLFLRRKGHGACCTSTDLQKSLNSEKVGEVGYASTNHPRFNPENRPNVCYVEFELSDSVNIATKLETANGKGLSYS